jgi:hypothetical protein
MNADERRLMEKLPMDGERGRLTELTEKIIGCAFDVANGLGAGFLEKV